MHPTGPILAFQFNMPEIFSKALASPAYMVAMHMILVPYSYKSHPVQLWVARVLEKTNENSLVMENGITLICLWCDILTHLIVHIYTYNQVVCVSMRIPPPKT